jgi:hypothetical protein
MKKRIDLPDGYDYEGPFIKQTSCSEFEYTVEYKARQSTNVEMSYLRLGWLSASIPYETLSLMNMVDIGSGNGVFVDCAKKVLGNACGYDLCGPSISEDSLMGTDWDIVVLSDVLEHYDDISDLFKIKWEYAMLSFPETPLVDSFDELMNWRHFKPNEHIYHLNLQGMREWLANIEPSVQIVKCGNFEDHIRKRWDETVPNITTMLIRRTE